MAAQGGDWIREWDWAACIKLDLPVLMIMLLALIARRDFGRTSPRLWAIVGVSWSAVTLGLHAATGSESTWSKIISAVALLGWLALSCALIILLASWTLRESLSLRRNRMLYWLALLAMIIAGQSLLLADNRWGTGMGLHLVGFAGVAVCTATNNLPNLKGLLRSVASRVITTLATVLLYLAGLLVALILFSRGISPHATLIGVVIIALILASIHRPFLQLVASAANRLVGLRGYDLTQVMRDYGRTVSNVRDLEQLAALAIQTIDRVLGIRKGALIIVSMAKNQVLLRVIEGIGQVSRKELAFTPHSPVLLYPPLSAEPFFQHDLDHHPVLRETSAEEKEQLRALEMEIFLPIMAQERLLGFLALGPQKSNEPYGPQEVAFLATLAQQTAAPLQNANLFEDMRALNAEITQLNKDLQKAYKQLKRLDQAKADFLSISSHELRTPLTVLQGYTDILEELAVDKVLTPEQTVEIARNLKTALERLATIVTAMLDASTIEAKALHLVFTPTTLQAVLSMALGQWENALKERNLHLTLRDIETIPPIQADLQRLCQAFSNIISNAIKYTPDHGQITIQARLDQDNEHYEVTIADTGVGIDPEDQELIFEKFYRVGSLLRHSTGETKFKGAGPGLGLHIAKGVIEAHGGRVWAESPGHDDERCPGSTFHIVLPIKAATRQHSAGSDKSR